MKLKEIPVSFYQSLRLRGMDPDRLLGPRPATAPLVVTLTTIPSRLHLVDLVIRSLLLQETAPEKIVLWLPEPLRGQEPSRLLRLVHERFAIRYTPLTCPHKKLIHTLEQFPEHTAVTCDDDLIYPRHWLGRLYETHQAHPGDIIGNQLRYIRYGADGDPLPYTRWVLPPEGIPNPRAVLAIGAGGVLYPQGSLDPRVQDRALFMELCPRADDLWFKMMSLLAGTRTRGPLRPAKEPLPIIGSQKHSLKKTNIAGDQNREQWIRLTSHFGVRP